MLNTKQYEITYPIGTSVETREAFEVLLKGVNSGTVPGLCLPVGFEFKEVIQIEPLKLTEKELELIVRILGVSTGRDSEVLVNCVNSGYTLWQKARDALKNKGVDVGSMEYDKRVVVSVNE
jgi:hypothetical protein